MKMWEEFNKTLDKYLAVVATCKMEAVKAGELAELAQDWADKLNKKQQTIPPARVVTKVVIEVVYPENNKPLLDMHTVDKQLKSILKIMTVRW